jgi:hypothetical protein
MTELKNRRSMMHIVIPLLLLKIVIVGESYFLPGGRMNNAIKTIKQVKVN